MKKWKCGGCCETEYPDAFCVIEVYAGEPTVCPITGDVAEWRIVKGGDKAEGEE